MKITITARHFDLSDPLRRHIEGRLNGLDRYHQRTSAIQVTLTDENRQKRVEARAALDGDVDVHAEATADDFRAAVNRVSQKLARQLKRRRDRRTDHQAPRLGEEIEPSEITEAGD